MSPISGRKLPLWKIIVFSLTPALLFFAVVEGASRIAWAYLEADAFAKHPNKIINFMEVPDPLLGYRLARNFDSGDHIYTRSIGRFQFQGVTHIHTNANGYMQREEVAPSRQKESLRIVTLGESTTQGQRGSELSECPSRSDSQQDELSWRRGNHQCRRARLPE